MVEVTSVGLAHARPIIDHSVHYDGIIWYCYHVYFSRLHACVTMHACVHACMHAWLCGCVRPYAVVNVLLELLKVNVAVCKDINLEFVTKKSFCHEFAARKCN